MHIDNNSINSFFSNSIDSINSQASKLDKKVNDFIKNNFGGSKSANTPGTVTGRSVKAEPMANGQSKRMLGILIGAHQEVSGDHLTDGGNSAGSPAPKTGHYVSARSAGERKSTSTSNYVSARSTRGGGYEILPELRQKTGSNGYHDAPTTIAKIAATQTSTASPGNIGSAYGKNTDQTGHGSAQTTQPKTKGPEISYGQQLPDDDVANSETSTRTNSDGVVTNDADRYIPVPEPQSPRTASSSSSGESGRDDIDNSGDEVDHSGYGQYRSGLRKSPLSRGKAIDQRGYGKVPTGSKYSTIPLPNDADDLPNANSVDAHEAPKGPISSDYGTIPSGHDTLSPERKRAPEGADSGYSSLPNTSAFGDSTIGPGGIRHYEETPDQPQSTGGYEGLPKTSDDE